MDIDVKKTPVVDVYHLLVGIVTPRPIAWVTTVDPQGVVNLAPFSFFNAVCTNPPTILFCPAVRGTDGVKKDTLINVEETGEFVVNTRRHGELAE